ncbi:FAD-dependent oxidoreductase [Chitinophaga sp.]|uniref:FAD-dependent oxidoreductase n=1 Tax=Chitinophaga sp. TaxID=1869181 RepID=UPI0031D68449
MISRDASTISLWQGNIDPFQPTLTADHNATYDVVIVGGGITGLTTALLLQEAGKRCLLLEAANIGFGTTGGTTAHLNTILDTSYDQIEKNFDKESAGLVRESVGAAIGLIQQNVERFSIDCGFNYTDAYLFAQHEKQAEALDIIAKATREAGVNITMQDQLPAAIPFAKAYKITDQASFNPLPYIYGLAHAFEKAGGVIVQDCRVIEIHNTQHIKVDTSIGEFTGMNIVYATHIPPGINLLHLRCTPYRSYAIAVRLADNAYPNALLYDMHEPYHYYRTQVVNGKKYLVVGGEDHKTGHVENTDQCFRNLEALVREQFNVKSVDYKWSSQFYESADGLPYIGYMPGQPDNVYVATGFGGNGMVYSGVAAMVIRNIIVGKHRATEKLFDPNRIKPIAGFTNFLTHNADVVKLFFGKLFPAYKLMELAELAPGQAQVVSYEGHRVAMYKDESGKLHAVNPVCTHLKCEVSWNMAEKSWDCPCHGARYDVDGRVLNTPADRDLEHLDISHDTSKVEAHEHI